MNELLSVPVSFLQDPFKFSCLELINKMNLLQNNQFGYQLTLADAEILGEQIKHLLVDLVGLRKQEETALEESFLIQKVNEQIDVTSDPTLKLVWLKTYRAITIHKTIATIKVWPCFHHALKDGYCPACRNAGFLLSYQV